MPLRILFLLLLAPAAFAQKPTPLLPGQVAVVYNSSIPESRELAEFYALNRRIPAQNLIGLKVTEKSTIARTTYEKTIRQPLVKKFIANKWWTMGNDKSGVSLPVESQIRCLVMLKGMPLRISRTAIPKGQDEKTRQFNLQNEAAIDSELSLMGISKYPIGGPIPNPYFQKDYAAAQNPAKYFLMVGRLDATTYDHCKRIILDSIEVEKEGLWGMTYLDLAKKGGNFAIGDKWIENIAKLSIKNSRPTIIDRMSNTYPTNYPMRDCAVYFGWYTYHRNGPFLNPAMKFQKGAIAVHLHSFSAEQLINPAKNWSAALLDRGAAATLGNTWEPYLQLSHHFDIFYDRLLKGYSLVEAGYMSMNVLSWQNIVIGDPLYTPYRTTEVNSRTLDGDRNYKIITYSASRFPDPNERLRQLLKAAEKTKNGTVYEMIGSHSLEAGQFEPAIKGYQRAKQLFTDPADKLRQDLHLVELERRRKNTAAALAILREAKITYKDIPESKAIDGLLTILDPPAPPAPPATKR